jgi:translation initiation factor IF-1
MPGKSNTNQTISKKNLHRIESNKKAVDESFDDTSTIFGRVIRMLGNSRVSIALDDATIVQATIRGLLRKKSTRIDIRDIVILEKADTNNYYIIGVITEKKDSNRLMKDGRIPKWFLSVNLECDESKKIVNISNDDYINNFDDDDEPKTYNTEEPVEEKYNEQKIPIFGGNNDETSKDLDIDDI